jgi:hypothetical protein
MNFLDMKTWNPASSSLWKEIVTRWGEDIYADSALREGKIAELKLEYESKQYQRQRATAYPSIAEQLDMQYWDGVNGTTTWADTVAQIKSENPKP